MNVFLLIFFFMPAVRSFACRGETILFILCCASSAAGQVRPRYTHAGEDHDDGDDDVCGVHREEKILCVGESTRVTHSLQNRHNTRARMVSRRYTTHDDVKYVPRRRRRDRNRCFFSSLSQSVSHAVSLSPPPPAPSLSLLYFGILANGTCSAAAAVAAADVVQTNISADFATVPRSSVRCACNTMTTATVARSKRRRTCTSRAAAARLENIN